VWAIATGVMVGRHGASSYIKINCVFHLRYRVFHGISKCICNNDEVYDILYRSVLSSEDT